MEYVWSEEYKYKCWLDIELAVCKARVELGEIPEKAFTEIKKNVKINLPRIKEIEKETRHDILAFIQGINETLGEESRFIHQGITSSDIKDTARSLQMKKSLALLKEGLEKLGKLLGGKASLHKDTIMIGRTHGIHAEPVTWGLKLLLWYQEIGRHLERFTQLEKRIAVGQISGAVGTYASVKPEVEKLVCRELALQPAVVSNQILQRDRHAEYLNNLALVAASLEKFATEIRNLQRTDILEVEEGFRKGQQGSSAMPHKKNPIVCERITGLARVVRANVIPGLENISLWHERDLTHSSAERIVLPDSSIALDYMLNKFVEVISELVVNKDKMKANMKRTHGLIFSQKVMLALIEKGLSRENAYQITQRNAMQSWQTGSKFQDLLKKDEQIKKYLTENELAQIFDYQSFLKEIDHIFKISEISERGQFKP